MLSGLTSLWITPAPCTVLTALRSCLAKTLTASASSFAPMASFKPSLLPRIDSSVTRPSSLYTRYAFAPATPMKSAAPAAPLSRLPIAASVWKKRRPCAPLFSLRSFKMTGWPLYVPSKTSPKEPPPIFLPFLTSLSFKSILIAGPSSSARSNARTVTGPRRASRDRRAVPDDDGWWTIIAARPRWAAREASARASATWTANAVAWDMDGGCVGWIPRSLGLLSPAEARRRMGGCTVSISSCGHALSRDGRG